jgi:hypothetical protein
MRAGRGYRLTDVDLMQTLENWERLLSFRVHLIACGGTALTLLGIKESTKDVDFTVPEKKEYERLMSFLSKLGYQEKGGGLAHPDYPFFLFQFWSGNRVFTVDLSRSPLEPGRNIPVKRWRHLYVGALNVIDLIITKMSRGTGVDMDDCVAVFATGKVDAETLLREYLEAARYDLNPKRMVNNFLRLTEKLRAAGLVTDQFLGKVRATL